MEQETKDKIMDWNKKPMFGFLSPTWAMVICILVIIALMAFEAYMLMQGAGHPCQLCEQKFDMQCVSLMVPHY